MSIKLTSNQSALADWLAKQYQDGNLQEVFTVAWELKNYLPFSHRRKITFRIRSMLAEQVGHDQVYRRTANHENKKEETNPSMPMFCLQKCTEKRGSERASSHQSSHQPVA